MIRSKKKKMTYIFIVILAIQFVLFFEVQDIGQVLLNVSDSSKATKVELSDTFIQDTVRVQQRTMLKAIRAGWHQYLINYPDIQLILTDSDGLCIYSNKKGEMIAFNDSTMRKVKQPDNYYNIYEKTSNKLLIKEVRPQWNKVEVKKILNVIATPIKAFGPTGDIIIFDSFTGEMIVDNSQDCLDEEKVLGPDGKRYITLDYLHSNNKAPITNKTVIEDEFMWKSDTVRGSNMIYFFNEPTNMKDKSSNFEDYPLGNYKREFQEKIILPSETIGICGEAMQITVISGAQELELIKPYQKLLNNWESSDKQLDMIINKTVFVPIISVLLSMLAMMFALYYIKIAEKL